MPNSGLPASFGWKSFDQPGDYLVADADAAHFSAAASGNDALLLASAGAIWQDVGATTANTTYALSFDVLTGTYAGDTRGTVTAEIFMGSTLIGAETATSPAASNVWQKFTLSVTTARIVSGDLMVEFVNDTGNAWLDNVTLAQTNV